MRIFFLCFTFIVSISFHTCLYAEEIDDTYTETMIIADKSDNFVVVNERKFILTESTKILDAQGNKMNIVNIVVPCKAEILYQLKTDEDPVCIKITVK